MIKISAVIPTKGRGRELIASVESLVAQTKLPFEIIISDQNNPPLMELEEYLSKFAMINHFRNTEPGLVKNYNQCLALAKGDVVLFLDDDIIAEPHLLENLENIYLKDSARTLAGVAGRVLNAHGDKDPQKIKRVGIYNSWTGQTCGNFNYDKSRNVEFAQGACMSFRREKLLAIGGFDERFIGNGYFFETDAGLKLTEKGYKILFDPSCVIDHLMAPRGGARVDKINHTYFYIRNGIRLQKNHGFFFQWPVFMLWTLGYLTLKSLYNRSPKLFLKSLKAVVDGIRTP